MAQPTTKKTREDLAEAGRRKLEAFRRKKEGKPSKQQEDKAVPASARADVALAAHGTDLGQAAVSEPQHVNASPLSTTRTNAPSSLVPSATSQSSPQPPTEAQLVGNQIKDKINHAHNVFNTATRTVEVQNVETMFTHPTSTHHLPAWTSTEPAGNDSVQTNRPATHAVDRHSHSVGYAGEDKPEQEVGGLFAGFNAYMSLANQVIDSASVIKPASQAASSHSQHLKASQPNATALKPLPKSLALPPPPPATWSTSSSQRLTDLAQSDAAKPQATASVSPRPAITTVIAPPGALQGLLVTGQSQRSKGSANDWSIPTLPPPPKGPPLLPAAIPGSDRYSQAAPRWGTTAHVDNTIFAQHNGTTTGTTATPQTSKSSTPAASPLATSPQGPAHPPVAGVQLVNASGAKVQDGKLQPGTSMTTQPETHLISSKDDANKLEARNGSTDNWMGVISSNSGSHHDAAVPPKLHSADKIPTSNTSYPGTQPSNGVSTVASTAAATSTSPPAASLSYPGPSLNPSALSSTPLVAESKYSSSNLPGQQSYTPHFLSARDTVSARVLPSQATSSNSDTGSRTAAPTDSTPSPGSHTIIPPTNTIIPPVPKSSNSILSWLAGGGRTPSSPHPTPPSAPAVPTTTPASTTHTASQPQASGKDEKSSQSSSEAEPNAAKQATDQLEPNHAEPYNTASAESKLHSTAPAEHKPYSTAPAESKPDGAESKPYGATVAEFKLLGAQPYRDTSQETKPLKSTITESKIPVRPHSAPAPWPTPTTSSLPLSSSGSATPSTTDTRNANNIFAHAQNDNIFPRAQSYNTFPETQTNNISRGKNIFPNTQSDNTFPIVPNDNISSTAKNVIFPSPPISAPVTRPAHSSSSWPFNSSSNLTGFGGTNQQQSQSVKAATTKYPPEAMEVPTTVQRPQSDAITSDYHRPSQHWNAHPDPTSGPHSVSSTSSSLQVHVNSTSSTFFDTHQNETLTSSTAPLSLPAASFRHRPHGAIPSYSQDSSLSTAQDPAGSVPAAYKHTPLFPPSSVPMPSSYTSSFPSSTSTLPLPSSSIRNEGHTPVSSLPDSRVAMPSVSRPSSSDAVSSLPGNSSSSHQLDKLSNPDVDHNGALPPSSQHGAGVSAPLVAEESPVRRMAGAASAWHQSLPPSGMSSQAQQQIKSLQQHIEELMEDKMELTRGLAQQGRLNESLAEENTALMERYNLTGKALEDAQARLKRYESEIEAQRLALNTMCSERDTARLLLKESQDRAAALAAENISLEKEMLQVKSSKLLLEKQCGDHGLLLASRGKQAHRAAQDMAHLQSLLEASQEEVRILSARLRELEASRSIEPIQPTTPTRAAPQPASTVFGSQAGEAESGAGASHLCPAAPVRPAVATQDQAVQHSSPDPGPPPPPTPSTSAAATQTLPTSPPRSTMSAEPITDLPVDTPPVGVLLSELRQLLPDLDPEQLSESAAEAAQEESRAVAAVLDMLQGLEEAQAQLKVELAASKAQSRQLLQANAALSNKLASQQQRLELLLQQQNIHHSTEAQYSGAHTVGRPQLPTATKNAWMMNYFEKDQRIRKALLT